MFRFYILHSYALLRATFCVIITISRGKGSTQQHFVTSSCMFLNEKTVLEVWLNPGLNLTIFWGNGPWCPSLHNTRSNLIGRGRTLLSPHKELFNISNGHTKMILTWYCKRFIFCWQWMIPFAMANLMVFTRIRTNVKRFTNAWEERLPSGTVLKEWCLILLWRHVTLQITFPAVS